MKDETVVERMKSLEVVDVGPVKHLEIKVPEGGGVACLRGRNGCGKSLVLDAASRLMGSKSGKVTATDGAAKGLLKGLGAKLTIGARMTTSGSLEVSAIEGKLDLARIIDPGIDDPVAADNRRIKAILSMLDAKVDLDKFHSLVGGDQAFGDLAIEPSEDLVELVARTKRKLESRSRDQEKKADSIRAKADALAAGCEGHTDLVGIDAKTLNENLDTAIQANANIKAAIEAATKANRVTADAQNELNRMDLPDMVELKAQATLDREELNQALADVEEAKKRLNEAMPKVEISTKRYEDGLEAHTQHEALVGIVQGARVLMPTEEQKLSAAMKVELARASMEEGVRARDAAKKLAKAESLANEADAHREQAEELRECAKDADGILTEVLDQLELPLQVVGGRLCTTTNRGVTPYGELSHGERVKLAIDLGLSAVGSGGVLVMGQEGWESLDPRNKAACAVHAQERQVCILTAASAVGDIRSEVYQC